VPQFRALYPRDAECLGNHTGVLCDACIPHHSRQGFVDNVCRPCGSVLEYTEATLGMPWQQFAAGGGGTLLLCYLFYYSQKTRLRRTKSEIFSNCRILFGSFQVLSLLSHTLDLVYPHHASTFLSAASVAVGNIMSFFRYTCQGWTWSVRRVSMVCVLPSVAFTIIIARFIIARFRRRNDEAGAANEVTRPGLELGRDAFFAVMVLYPQVSWAILSALRCRKLGEDYSVLMADYSVRCSGGSDENDRLYQQIRIAAIVLTILIPIGIPAGLLFVLWREWRKSVKRWSTAEIEMHDQMRAKMHTSTQLADHMRTSLADDQGAGGALRVETAEEYHYARIQGVFGIVVDDFKPSCWWFEPVDSMYCHPPFEASRRRALHPSQSLTHRLCRCCDNAVLRKLALSGLLQFIEQGTATQVFCGTCSKHTYNPPVACDAWVCSDRLLGITVAFFSFGLQLSLSPYRHAESNLLKAAVDAQLFIAFLLSFILRVLDRLNTYEPLNTEDFGKILIGSICCLLLAFLGLTGSQVYRHKAFRSGLVDAASMGFQHGEGSAVREQRQVWQDHATDGFSVGGSVNQQPEPDGDLGREMSAALQRGTVSTRHGNRRALAASPKQPLLGTSSAPSSTDVSEEPGEAAA